MKNNILRFFSALFALSLYSLGLQGQTLVPLTGSNTVSCGTNTTVCDPGGCTTNYPDNANGHTVLQGAGSSVITITGTFDIENGWDYLYIVDGAGTGGTVLQTYTGIGTINFTSLPGQTITLHFESDGIFNELGFNVNVVYTGNCELLVPQTGSLTLPCGTTGSTMYDNGGSTGNYANNSDGHIVLEAAFQSTISLAGTYDVENNFDFIRIYDGAGTAGTLLATFTGTGTLSYTGNPGQTLTVQFTSNGSVTASGFAIDVTSSGLCNNTILVPATGSTTIPCGTDITLCDPGGCTADYPSNANGFVVLENDATGVITITGSYDVENNWDYVYIYAGIGTGGILLNTYTGLGTINFVSQPGQTITIQFESDAIINFPGFNFTVEYTGSCINCPAPSAAISVAPASPVCFGSSPQLEVTTTSGGPYTYSWSPAASLSDATLANPVANTLTATESFEVTLTDALGCTQTAATTVTVLPQTNVNITANGPTTFCAGDTTILSSNVGGASITDYLWNDGLTTAFNPAATSDNYQVTVTDANGCTAESNSISVTVNSPTVPTITANGPTSFCFGDMVELSVPASYTGYLWSNGETTAAISAMNSGTFDVTVSDANGCEAASSNSEVVVANQNPFPLATITGPVAICAGVSTDIETGSFASYLWSNGETTQSINVSATGNYNVTVVDANGCEGFSADVTVMPGNTPTPSIYAQGCDVLDVSTDPFASYLWSTGETTQQIQVSTSGTVALTVTTSAGCEGTASQNISVPTALSLVLDSVVDETSQIVGEINVSVLGGSAPYNFVWSNGQTGSSISGLIAGDYTVRIVDANGCVATGTYTVSYSIPVLNLQELQAAGIDVKVFPNPTSSLVQATIDLGAQQQDLGYELLDALGRRIDFRAPVPMGTQATFEFNLGDKPSGIYLLRLFIGDKQTVQMIQRR